MKPQRDRVTIIGRTIKTSYHRYLWFLTRSTYLTNLLPQPQLDRHAIGRTNDARLHFRYLPQDLGGAIVATNTFVLEDPLVKLEAPRHRERHVLDVPHPTIKLARGSNMPLAIHRLQLLTFRRKDRVEITGMSPRRLSSSSLRMTRRNMSVLDGWIIKTTSI